MKEHVLNNDKVYCAINESMPGLVKIGFTGYDDIRSRLYTLSNNTCVPTNFVCPFYLEVPFGKGSEIEKGIHQLLKSLGIQNVGKEFFLCDYKQLYSLFKAITFLFEEDVLKVIACSMSKEKFNKKESVFAYFRANTELERDQLTYPDNPKGYL